MSKTKPKTKPKNAGLAPATYVLLTDVTDLYAHRIVAVLTLPNEEVSGLVLSAKKAFAADKKITTVTFSIGTQSVDFYSEDLPVDPSLFSFTDSQESDGYKVLPPGSRGAIFAQNRINGAIIFPRLVVYPSLHFGFTCYLDDVFIETRLLPFDVFDPVRGRRL